MADRTDVGIEVMRKQIGGLYVECLYSMEPN
jgi:hypothetical protein